MKAVVEEVNGGEKAESTRERLKATSGERCAALGQWMGGRGR